MATAKRQLAQHTKSGVSNIDNSLQGKALARALGTTPPRTLTPYEWQQWYADHGVPEEHTAQAAAQAARTSWWRRLLKLADFYR